MIENPSLGYGSRTMEAQSIPVRRCIGGGGDRRRDRTCDVGHVAYVIAFASMMTSDCRQRLGDRWGETYVVRAENSGAFKSIEERAAMPGACVVCGELVEPGTDVCPHCGRLAPHGR